MRLTFLLFVLFGCLKGYGDITLVDPTQIPNQVTMNVSYIDRITTGNLQTLKVDIDEKQLANLCVILETCQSWEKIANDNNIIINNKVVAGVKPTDASSPQVFFSLSKESGKPALISVAFSVGGNMVFQGLEDSELAKLIDSAKGYRNAFSTDPIKKNTEMAETLFPAPALPNK